MTLIIETYFYSDR